MSLCGCGHDFTDHHQTDVEYLCLLCSWCDGYTKAAANDSATAPVPAGGTPEGLAREKVEMTDSEVKPSSPTTEAGRAFVAIATSQGTGLGHLPDPLPVIVARIEQQARDEGRRERPTTEPHVHVIPLGYGDHEANEGETYSLVQCRECLEMLAIAPGRRALEQ